MNKRTLQGKLRKTRGRLKGRWARLTSDDVGQLEAKYDEMIGLFQERYGYTQERARNELSHFLQNYTSKRKNVLPWETSSQRNPLLIGGLVLGLIMLVRIVAHLVTSNANSTPENSYKGESTVG